MLARCSSEVLPVAHPVDVEDHVRDDDDREPDEEHGESQVRMLLPWRLRGIRRPVSPAAGGSVLPEVFGLRAGLCSRKPEVDKQALEIAPTVHDRFVGSNPPLGSP
jgi:hypothetical protein